jgi:hypothetical protein
MKTIFNNKQDVTKMQLWDLLFNLYIQLEKVHNPESPRIDLLKDNLKVVRSNFASSLKNDIFKNNLTGNVNDKTNNMLDEIIGSFQSVVNNNGNPFDSIMSITEKISQKYATGIETGDIQIDKVLGGMSDLIKNTMGANGLGKMGDLAGMGNLGDLAKMAGFESKKETVAAAVTITSPAKKGQRGKKFCPSCEELMPIHCQKCKNCDHEFHMNHKPKKVKEMVISQTLY